MTEERIIRKMLFEDIEKLANAFIQQVWPGWRETLGKCLDRDPGIRDAPQ